MNLDVPNSPAIDFIKNIQTLLMAVTFIGCFQPGLEDLQRQHIANHTSPQNQDVGIIVLPAQNGGN